MSGRLRRYVHGPIRWEVDPDFEESRDGDVVVYSELERLVWPRITALMAAAERETVQRLCLELRDALFGGPQLVEGLDEEPDLNTPDGSSDFEVVP